MNFITQTWRYAFRPMMQCDIRTPLTFEELKIKMLADFNYKKAGSFFDNDRSVYNCTAEGDIILFQKEDSRRNSLCYVNATILRHSCTPGSFRAEIRYTEYGKNVINILILLAAIGRLATYAYKSLKGMDSAPVLLLLPLFSLLGISLAAMINKWRLNQARTMIEKAISTPVLQTR